MAEPGSLSTERLDLLVLSRPFCEAIVAGDRTLAAALLGFPLGRWPEEPELGRAFPRYLAWSSRDAGSGPWQGRAIVPRALGRVVGSVSLKGPPVEGRVEVGYGLLAEHRGQGFAREAVVAVVGWALAQPGVDEVIATIDPTNAASERVARAAGLHPTGRPAERPAGCFVWSTRP